MRVFCKYDLELDRFLKSVVSYVFNLFGNDIVLNCLEEIELVKQIEGAPIETDGRISGDGRKITLTARLFDRLPTYDISKLKLNEEFQTIVCTIYHEMGHIADRSTMPSIYAAAVPQSTDDKQILAPFFWAEYLAEKRSSKTNLVSYQDFCDDFVKREWKSFDYNFDNPTEANFFFLCKMLAYFMGRTTRENVRETFCRKVVNPLLKEFIDVLGKELVDLEQKFPFDDVKLLDNLSNVLIEYCSKFSQKFAQI